MGSKDCIIITDRQQKLFVLMGIREGLKEGSVTTKITTLDFFA